MPKDTGQTGGRRGRWPLTAAETVVVCLVVIVAGVGLLRRSGQGLVDDLPRPPSASPREDGVSGPAGARPEDGALGTSAASGAARGASATPGAGALWRPGEARSGANAAPVASPRSPVSPDMVPLLPAPRSERPERPGAAGSPGVLPRGSRPVPPFAAAPASLVPGPAPEATPGAAPGPTPTPDASSDRKPPSVLSLQFSPPRVRDGTEATLLAQIVDDLSGVQHANGVLTSPSGRAALGFSFARAGDPDAYTARLAIPRDAEAGEWYVSWMSLGDGANNTTSVGYTAGTAPPGWRLVVESSAPDAKPPTLGVLWLDRQAVPEKEAVRVFVRADDDASGVASVSGIFQSPSKKALLGFAGRFDAEADAWVGSVSVPAGADCGDWTLVSVHLADKARNVVTVPGSDPVLQRAGFTVTRSGACDAEPPVLQAISLAPPAVSNEQPAIVEVTALVSDDVTGTRAVSGRVEGPLPPGPGAVTPRIHFACTRQGSDPSAPWTGRITVPRFSASGTWRVTWLQTQDAAGNSRTYTGNDAVLGPAAFEVR